MRSHIFGGSTSVGGLAVLPRQPGVGWPLSPAPRSPAPTLVTTGPGGSLRQERRPGLCPPMPLTPLAFPLPAACNPEPWVHSGLSSGCRAARRVGRLHGVQPSTLHRDWLVG